MRERCADALLIENSTSYANTAPYGAAPDNNSKPVLVGSSTLVAAPRDNALGSVYPNYDSTTPARPVFSRTILAGRRRADFPVVTTWNIGSPISGCNLDVPSLWNISPAELAPGPRADNGGPAPTMRPQSGSVATGFPGAQCSPLDQRGFLRTAPCDAGAAESDGIDDAIFSDGFD